MKEVAVVSGATAGFGKAIAYKLAQNGFDLIITGRRKDRLDAIASDIQSKFQVDVLPLCFDVRSEADLHAAFETIPASWKRWTVLINNAGLAVGRDALDQGVVDDWERMIDTNIKGLLYMTRTFVRLMIDNRKGTIVNIGSIAGKEVYPGGNVYSATKFAVDSLTRSMRIDFNAHGIRVGQVAPGAAETEFSIVRFKGDQEKADKVYEGFVPLSAEDIAEAVEFIVKRPAHVSISDIVIMPTAQANSTLINRE
ncbi:MAG: SDR family NAD(P)-dependent oxidoreductase [Flavobacteriales bacterium]